MIKDRLISNQLKGRERKIQFRSFPIQYIEMVNNRVMEVHKLMTRNHYMVIPIGMKVVESIK